VECGSEGAVGAARGAAAACVCVEPRGGRREDERASAAPAERRGTGAHRLAATARYAQLELTWRSPAAGKEYETFVVSHPIVVKCVG
jgi:hypothetical protein